HANHEKNTIAMIQASFSPPDVLSEQRMIRIGRNQITSAANGTAIATSTPTTGASSIRPNATAATSSKAVRIFMAVAPGDEELQGPRADCEDRAKPYRQQNQSVVRSPPSRVRLRSRSRAKDWRFPPTHYPPAARTRRCALARAVHARHLRTAFVRLVPSARRAR